MSKSPEPHAAMEEGAILLPTIPGTGAPQNTQSISSTGPGTASFFRDDKHHRKLAICSIICGNSCIGIKSLINSVKAESAEDPDTAAEFSKRAKKFGIIAIVVWVSILALTPALLALVSYLLTLGDE